MSKLKKTLGVAALLADLTLLTTGCFSGVVDLDDDFPYSGNAEVVLQANFPAKTCASMHKERPHDYCAR